MTCQAFKKIPRILGDLCIPLYQHVGEWTDDRRKCGLTTVHQLRCNWCCRPTPSIDLCAAGRNWSRLLYRASIAKNPLGALDKQFALAKIINVLRDHAYQFAGIRRRPAGALYSCNGVGAEIGQYSAREFSKNGRVDFACLYSGAWSITGVQCVFTHVMRNLLLTHCPDFAVSLKAGISAMSLTHAARCTYSAGTLFPSTSVNYCDAQSPLKQCPRSSLYAGPMPSARPGSFLTEIFARSSPLAKSSMRSMGILACAATSVSM